MNLKDLTGYLIIPPQENGLAHYLLEMKRREWILIAVRFLWVPVIFILAGLHHPDQQTVMMILGGVLSFCNVIACILNIKIKTMTGQKALDIVLVALDTLIAWGIILLFVKDFYTAAYAGFVYVIIEAAIRFGLKGSLSMALFFVIALFVTYLYRSAVFGLRFSVSGYVFWVVLMAIIAIVVGAIVQEGKKQRAVSERRLQENTLLEERHRLARELHDTVLKTLQGLSLEARALGNNSAATILSVKATAQYIEDVCSRTSREIREVIFDLRRDNTTAGIAGQISQILDEWSKNTGIAANINLSGQDKVMPQETARQIRQIVAEALTNVRRHAAATGVIIGVTVSAVELSIEISDNGHGMEHNINEINNFVAQGKLGLAGVKERVELLGGHFSIAGGKTGTRLSVVIPVAEK